MFITYVLYVGGEYNGYKGVDYDAMLTLLSVLLHGDPLAIITMFRKLMTEQLCVKFESTVYTYFQTSNIHANMPQLY